MFSRYIDKVDFKSRFRILKGGKVSLVVSAMLISSSLVGTSVNAETIEWDGTAAPYVITPALAENTNVEINGDITTTNASAVIIDATNSLNGNTLTVNNSGFNGINVIGDTDANALSGINIYNLSAPTTGYHEIKNYAKIKVSNEGGDSFGITSITGSGTGGDWNKVNILNLNEIDISSVGYAEGIYVEGDLTNSTITNNTTAIIKAMTTNAEAYGIDIGDDMIDSQVVNNGMINVGANSEVDITTDLIDNNNIDLKSIGINVASAVQSSADGESTIINNATLTSDALLTINVTGGKNTFLLASEAKGISVNSLQGTDSDHESKINNNEDGNIEVSSKLNINFATEGDSIASTDWNGINSKAIGIEVSSSAYYASIMNQGAITSLSKITIDEKGTINTSYVYAVSSGILVNGMNNSAIGSNVIDSQAIFNGTNYASATSEGIKNRDDVEDSSILSLDIISKAQATATKENGISYSNAYGTSVGGTVSGGSIIGNFGNIEAEATSEADGYSSARARGINIDSTDGALIGNGISEEDSHTNLKVTATSTSTSGDAYAQSYGMYLGDFANTQVVNYGTIEVTSTANSYDYSTANATGIRANTQNTSTENPVYEITNLGTITAKTNTSMLDINGSSYAEAYGISVSHYVDHAFTLNNSGTIEAYFNNELDEDAYSLGLYNYSQDGDIEVINSGTLKGNIYVEGTLENSGLISLPYNAEKAFIRDFTNTGTGRLEIGLLTKGSMDNTAYSQLETNTATFNNGSTINVNVLEASQNVGLLAGSKLENVVTANNFLTINGPLNITDNSALLNFEYETSGLEGDPWTNGEAGSINLKIIKGQTVEEAVKNISPKVTQHTNAQGAANALDRIIDNIDNNPQMQTVITRLNQLSSNEAVARAVESTTPVAANATVGATTQISNGIAGIVTQRQNANISAGGMNSGDGMFSENNMWIKPFGSIGSQNNKDGINGFDVKTYGLGFGADTEYKNNQKLGLAFFYTNANVDVNNMNQNADLDVFTTLVYGNVPIIDDKTNFLYQVGYSWQKTQTDREVFTGDKAESKYTSKTASLDLKVMRDVNVNKDLLLQPLVNTTYRHFTNPAYNETGADALNLNVDKFTSTDLIVGLGTLAHYKLDKESKIVGNVNVGYDLHDKNQTITSAYEGASGVNFGTDGIDNGRWSYEAGIGYEKDISATSAINIAYDYQGQGTDFSNNIVSAKYVLKF